MEEDIEYLEQLIGIKKEYKCKPIKSKTQENTKQAIENLIARYKELEKENKKMKANNLLKLNKEINKNIQVAYGGRRYNTEGIVIENYIPKSKVKEKIEELDIRIGECCENIDKTVDEERAYWEKEKRDAIMQRFILQEFLD